MILIVLIMVSLMLVGCDGAVRRANAGLDAESNDNREQEQPEPVGDQVEVSEPSIPVTTQSMNDHSNNQMTRETRAIWSWAGRKRTSDRNKISRLDIDELVAKVDAAHLNVILLHVYHQGTAYFEPSHTRFPDSSERLTNQSAFVDDEYGDALSYLLAIRDQRRSDDNPLNDFEVHAWISVHRGGEQEDGQPPIDKTEPYMLNAIFPEFKQKIRAYYSEGDDRFIEHSVSVIHQPRFRAYMVDLIAGLVEDYEIDGVHLDYIRTDGICFNDDRLDYPGTAYDYPGCQEDYKAWTLETYGHEYTLLEDTTGNREIKDEARQRVIAWLERAVGLLVKDIHDEVKSINPDIIISVASVRNDISRTTRSQMINGQAAWEWLDQGWVDAIFVAAYSSDTQGVVDKIRIVREAIKNEDRRSRVFPGLATHDTDDREDEQGRSYLLAEQVYALIHEQWSGQPLQPPAAGVGLFRAGRLSQAGIQALAEGPFKEPALPFWGE